MNLSTRIATAAAVAATALGLGAAGASAYSISGGPYTGTSTAANTFTVGGGAYTVSCATTTISGNATGSATTNFAPSYGGCTFFGLPATMVQTGFWSTTVTSGPILGRFRGDLTFTPGSATTLSVPIAGCVVSVAGPQTFQDGVGGTVVQDTNVSGGVQFEAVLTNIAYTASGCPFASGNDGVYRTNGPISIPGVTIT
jgi:hypothetical protein